MCISTREIPDVLFELYWTVERRVKRLGRDAEHHLLFEFFQRDGAVIRLLKNSKTGSTTVMGEDTSGVVEISDSFG
jgi:hypothetical protein